MLVVYLWPANLVGIAKPSVVGIHQCVDSARSCGLAADTRSPGVNGPRRLSILSHASLALVIDLKVFRQLNKLSTKTSDYENLLRDLSSVVDGRAAERIKLVLEKVSFNSVARCVLSFFISPGKVCDDGLTLISIRVVKAPRRPPKHSRVP